VWGTFFGGEALDKVDDIIVGDSNNIYVSGATNSPSGITTPGTHLSNYNSTGGLITKFDKDGNQIWGTYTADGWAGSALTLDKFGHLYLISSVQHSAADTTVYTPGAHQTTL